MIPTIKNALNMATTEINIVTNNIANADQLALSEVMVTSCIPMQKTFRFLARI